MVNRKQSLTTRCFHFSRAPGVFFFLLFILAVSNCWGDADAIYGENSPSVIVVIAIDREGKSVSQGSGFIVSEDGAVVTGVAPIKPDTSLT